MGIIKDIKINEYGSYNVINAFEANGKVVKGGKVIFKKEGATIPQEGYAIHDDDEYVCVLKGTISFGTEEHVYKLNEGEFHFMPKGKKHWCKSLTNEESELMFILIS